MLSAIGVAGSVRHRIMAAWLLFAFLFAQAVPVFAVTVEDSMSTMACCKKGKDSCCRRKPMQSPPSFRAGNPCGEPCAGTPAVPLNGMAAIVVPTMTFIATVEPMHALQITASQARSSAGIDPSLYQRPPPKSL